MKNILPIYTLLVLGLLFPIIVPAQGLGPLPQASEITAGQLGNGIHYYLVTNPSYRGMADIALVQKAGTLDEPYEDKGSAVVRSRAALTELGHFSTVTPFQYMAGKSLWPGPEGYARVSDHTTVYRFDNLVTSRKGAVIDSTLLMVFDIIDRDYGRMEKTYSTDNQAIIVSGDIDASAVLGKMNMLSLFVSSRTSGGRTLPYEWHDLMTPTLSVSQGRPCITVQYRFPRTRQDRMNTAVPLVSARYAEELKRVLEGRLTRALRAERIPLARLDCRYSGSAEQPGDETFTLTLEVDAASQVRALQVLAHTLCSLDMNGVSAEEYRDVSGALTSRIYTRFGSPFTENRRYMDRCVAAFLYGASLASDQTSLAFFMGRRLEDEASVRLFNNYIAALLDRSRNLTLSWQSPGQDQTEESVRKLFQEAWTPFNEPVPISRGDTLTLIREYAKTKLKATLPETLFGGEVWTFANGIKVIYKQVPQKGYFRWNWVLKGGYASLPGISDGEGAFLADMLRQEKVAGLSADRFYAMLAANGITLDTDVTFSETTLSGVAPDGKLPRLLKSLLALTTSREPDAEAYAYYRRCEALRTQNRSVDAVLDSLMHQSMTYTPYKRPISLRDDFLKRADRFYGSAFAKMNDGVLILVGGMDKARVQKTLSLYLGGFRTEKASSIRSRVRHGLREGRNRFRTRAAEPELAVSLSAPINYTAENFMAAHIAAVTMRDHVAAAAAPAGWCTDADWTVRMFPDESLDLTLRLRRADIGGLPASMVREDSTDVILERVRQAIDRTGALGISEEELKVGKSVVSNYYASWSADPQSIMRMLVLRYSYGKDLVTDYAARIASVGAGTVNPILSLLALGGSGEYVAVRSQVPPLTEPVVPAAVYPYIPPMTYVKGAYPFDGSVLPPTPMPLDSLRNLPVQDYGPDSAHIVWRDSVVTFRALRAVEQASEPLIESILHGK